MSIEHQTAKRKHGSFFVPLAVASALGVLLFMHLSSPLTEAVPYPAPITLDAKNGCFIATHPISLVVFDIPEKTLPCLTLAERESVLAQAPSLTATQKLARAEALRAAALQKHREATVKRQAELMDPMGTARRRLGAWFL